MKITFDSEVSPFSLQSLQAEMQEIQNKMSAYVRDREEYAICWAIYFLPDDAMLILNTYFDGRTKSVIGSDVRKANTGFADAAFLVIPEWMYEVQVFVETHLIDKISETMYQLKPIVWDWIKQ